MSRRKRPTLREWDDVSEMIATLARKSGTAQKTQDILQEVMDEIDHIITTIEYRMLYRS
jgi:hypothetical protein